MGPKSGNQFVTSSRRITKSKNQRHTWMRSITVHVLAMWMFPTTPQSSSHCIRSSRISNRISRRQLTTLKSGDNNNSNANCAESSSGVEDNTGRSPRTGALSRVGCCGRRSHQNPVLSLAIPAFDGTVPTFSTF